MPCYVNIQTVITDLDSLEKAAAELGITVEKHSANLITLRKGSDYIKLERQAGSKKFDTVRYSGSNNWPETILNPLLPAYAKKQIKKFAARKGMTVSAGAKQGQYVLTSYK